MSYEAEMRASIKVATRNMQGVLDKCERFELGKSTRDELVAYFQGLAEILTVEAERMETLSEDKPC